MKKSEILNNVFGSRVLSYYRIETTDILVVEVRALIWSDFTKKFIEQIIDVQAASSNTIKVSFDCTEWD